MKKSLVFCLLLIVSCNRKHQLKKQIELTKTIDNINESGYTILKFDSNWDWIFNNAEPTIIDDYELNTVNEIVNLAIEENNAYQKERLKKHTSEYPEDDWTETGFELNLDNGYNRQYVPALNEYGEKVVWVNFLCSDFKENWKNELIVTYDGGNCYFNIKVNLTKKNYSELKINGYG